MRDGFITSAAVITSIVRTTTGTVQTGFVILRPADDGISIPPLPAPFPAAHRTAREIEGTRFSLRRWLRRMVRRGVRV